jgi:hypothetical protein
MRQDLRHSHIEQIFVYFSQRAERMKTLEEDKTISKSSILNELGI